MCLIFLVLLQFLVLQVLINGKFPQELLPFVLKFGVAEEPAGTGTPRRRKLAALPRWTSATNKAA